MLVDLTLNYIKSDGGRAEAGFKGKAGDCVVRAIAIALKKDYKEVYDEIAKRNEIAEGVKSARNGTRRKVYEKYLNEQGWVWHSAPKFEGRKARCFDMPKGLVIARQARHLVAVWDGIPIDTFDPTRKMVYGYFAPKG